MNVIPVQNSLEHVIHLEMVLLTTCITEVGGAEAEVDRHRATAVEVLVLQEVQLKIL